MTTLRSRVIRLAHEKPELRDHLLPILKSASEIGPEGWDLLQKIYDVTPLSFDDKQLAKELTRQGYLDFDPEDPGHPWGVSFKGMDLLRKPRPAPPNTRQGTAEQISQVLKLILPGMGADYDRPKISPDFREVGGAYRSRNLPKEGAYSVGEHVYDEMVAKEISAFKKRLDPALAPHKNQIARVMVDDGEKSWVYVTVILK